MDRPAPIVRLLHISDLHFGPPYVPEVGNALLRIAPDLNVDAIIASGDFTQRAKADQFEAARSFLDRLPDVPRLCVPGNHDIPLYRVRERLVDPHGLYRQFISPELNPVLSLDDAVIVGIDSTAPHSAISNGRIHQWQLETAEKVFAEAPTGVARIVVAHHHFAPAPDYLHDRAMPQAKRAIMRFVEDDVDMILGGHLHRAYIGNTLDFYPGAHRERGIVIVQSGTTTSRRGRGREREKNSFNVIDIDEHTMKITHYLYFDADAGFVPGSRHLFPRGVLPLPSYKPSSDEPAAGDGTEAKHH
ncbi:MAG: metallophosphoesterase [Fuerstiella sp.]